MKASRLIGLLGLLVMFLPVFIWPILALLAMAGCTGVGGGGVICPLIGGIDLQTVATQLVHLSTKGLAYSIPVGAALLVLTSVLSQKRKSKH